VVLMSGLQGSGKTTFSGKLSATSERKASKPCWWPDVYRPAAIDQLETLGKQLDVEVFSDRENKDPVSIAQKGIAYAKQHGFTAVIIDTAGRLAIDEAMMDEIARDQEGHQPAGDALRGGRHDRSGRGEHRQGLQRPPEHRRCGADQAGRRCTRWCGPHIRSVVDKPIKFIGTGEKMEAMDEFHPDRMAGRILGMGDVVSLVEKRAGAVRREGRPRAEQEDREGPVRLRRLPGADRQIKKMGNMKDLMGMIPGVGKAMKNLDIPDDAFKGIEAIIKSMTPDERKNPALINGTRRATHRQGQRQQHRRGEQADEAVRRDPEDDEDDGRQDQDAEHDAQMQLTLLHLYVHDVYI
jgi:signal recognition particle subunit SRP54